MDNSWIEAEKYYGQFNGNLYKACVDVNYFDENGFINDEIIKSMAQDYDVPLEKARNVELMGYAPGNICYDIYMDDPYFTLYFAPIVVYSYNGELYDIVTGLKVVPREEGAKKNCLAVDRIESLSDEELDIFLYLMMDADNTYDRDCYHSFLKAVHKKQLKENKKYVRD